MQAGDTVIVTQGKRKGLLGVIQSVCGNVAFVKLGDLPVRCMPQEILRVVPSGDAGEERKAANNEY